MSNRKERFLMAIGFRRAPDSITLWQAPWYVKVMFVAVFAAVWTGEDAITGDTHVLRELIHLAIVVLVASTAYVALTRYRRRG